MVGRLRVLAVGVGGGALWGSVLAVLFGAPVIDGLRLGVALFTPAIVLSARPRVASAADAVFVPGG